MILSDLEAFAALAVALFIFWKFCNVDSSSHAAGTARESQGEGGAGARTARTPCRDCEDVR